jgi:hypothetical protein
VLTEALLKFGAGAEKCRSKLIAHDTQLPGFAIREFKAGPLSNWVWLHNKIASTTSLSVALVAIQALSRTPKRHMTSTALEALEIARSQSIAKKTLNTLTAKYGPTANVDQTEAAEIRLYLQKTIIQAWRKRRALVTSVVCELTCYQEIAPEQKRGLLSLQPNKCYPVGECCLAAQLRGNTEAIRALRDANQTLPENSESKRRGRVLNDLLKNPKFLLNENDCRSLGDAMFAFFCPAGTEIITTNLKDHVPLAMSLGKIAVAP